MVHRKFGVGRVLGPVLVLVAWITAAGVPVASPSLDVQRCKGCRGLTGYGDEAYAPPPCTQSPYGAWSVAVSCDVFEGKCGLAELDGLSGCLGSPCESTVTYSWGSEVADASLEVGSRQPPPIKGGDTIHSFGSNPPWEKGKTGAITYDPGINPDISCGDEITYFIKGDLCGPFEASVFGRCTPCKVPPLVPPITKKGPLQGLPQGALHGNGQ